MKIKVDPRTGKIVGGRPRPIRPPDHPIYPGSVQTQAVIDTEALMLIAREMGKVIAEEMKSAGPQVIERQVAVGTYQGSASDFIKQSTIEIDESVLDVGIGETDDLKVGDGSADLAKKEEKHDSSLQQAKNKLKSLKKGK